MIAEPAVAHWWGLYDRDRVLAEMAEVASFAIVVDDAVAGWLMVDEETDPDFPSVAFDITLATAFHGQAYGREALRLVIRHYIARGHHRFTIDPAADNEVAIRCYAAVGFKPVGVLRAYERRPGGGTRDGLLMDLLAQELEG